MMILIDNYDSFTYNLYHYLCELGEDVEVIRNDATTADEIINRNPRSIMISPGPSNPDNAGICLDLIKKATGEIPLFGVCLGHQAIAQSFGGKIIRADKPVHGKIGIIKHNGKNIFADIKNNFEATRYHSLIVERKTLPKELEITAELDDGTIMALSHRQHNIHSVQFHPESIISQFGHDILRNFIKLSIGK